MDITETLYWARRREAEEALEHANDHLRDIRELKRELASVKFDLAILSAQVSELKDTIADLVIPN